MAKPVNERVGKWLETQRAKGAKRTSVLLYKETLEKLESLQGESGQSQTEIINRAIMAYLVDANEENTERTWEPPVSTNEQELALTITPNQETEKREEQNSVSMKAAYDQVGHGRGFVRIHRIREALGWSREAFDRVLMECRMERLINLHVGDPSALTKEEVENSFQDETGALFITVTWK